MKIFVQGTIGGYVRLYPVQTPDEFYSFATDIRPQSRNALNEFCYYGKSLYSIAFTRGGRIFTKYVLGNDVPRSNLGDISFSVFVPDNNKLQGKSVAELLDALSEKYIKTYAPEFSLKQQPIDWGVFTAIADQYDSKLLPVDQLDADHFEKGARDAAYIYYSSREQLLEYFDDPYQEAYTPYSQIFFIDASLKEKSENPLNVIRHSPDADLSGRIDLENKKFRLIIKPSPNVEVKVSIVSADGREEFLSSNKKFFKKDELHIKWSREYYHSLDKKGTMDNLKEYLDINEAAKTVSVKQRDLQIITKDIQLQLLYKDKSIDFKEVNCSNSNGEEVKLIDGRLHFEGPQIYRSWTISASKTDSNDVCTSVKYGFIPKDAPEILSINAIKKKIIKFKFIAQKEISDVEISLDGGHSLRNRPSGGKIVLCDDEINKDYSLRFSARGYEYDKKSFPLNLKNQEKEITIPLRPIPGYVKPGEGGGSLEHGPHVEKSWLQRNLLPLILVALLLISLTINVIQAVRIGKLRSEILVNEAREYVEGSELFYDKLYEYSEKKAIKNDLDLSGRLQEAQNCRRSIDHYDFQISRWNKYYSNQLGELSGFYKLCKENESKVNGMQEHLAKVWGGDRVKDQPMKEIVDTLVSFLESETRKAVEPDPVDEDGQDEVAADKDENKIEPGTPDEGGRPHTVPMPEKEKLGFGGWFKKKFGLGKK